MLVSWRKLTEKHTIPTREKVALAQLLVFDVNSSFEMLPLEVADILDQRLRSTKGCQKEKEVSAAVRIAQLVRNAATAEKSGGSQQQKDE